ncbi:MAG: tRNA (cytidine(34)-2'-O)-methyltransferase [Maribacter stanieri]
MSLNIVLIEPEIPNNTGNIGRLALATGSTLHLVKPFGFELSDKRLKRAGLDYWQHLNVIMYDNVDAFFKQHQDKKMIFFSATATKNHWEIEYTNDMFLVFGKESVGLPKSILTENEDNAVKIPLYSKHIRSLNLANAVAISVYEGLRQLD